MDVCAELGDRNEGEQEKKGTFIGNRKFTQIENKRNRKIFVDLNFPFYVAHLELISFLKLERFRFSTLILGTVKFSSFN